MDTDKLITLPHGSETIAVVIVEAVAAANGRRRKRTLDPHSTGYRVALRIYEDQRGEGVYAEHGGTVSNSYGSPSFKTGLVVAWIRDGKDVKVRVIADEMRAGQGDAQFPVRGLFRGDKLMISPAQLIAEAEELEALAARDASKPRLIL